MEGEHELNGKYSWDKDPIVGIIPRALQQLFAELEQQVILIDILKNINDIFIGIRRIFSSYIICRIVQ